MNSPYLKSLILIVSTVYAYTQYLRGGGVDSRRLQDFNVYKSYRHAAVKPPQYSTKKISNHDISEYLSPMQLKMYEKRNGKDTPDVMFKRNWSGFNRESKGGRSLLSEESGGYIESSTTKGQSYNRAPLLVHRQSSNTKKNIIVGKLIRAVDDDGGAFNPNDDPTTSPPGAATDDDNPAGSSASSGAGDDLFSSLFDDKVSATSVDDYVPPAEHEWIAVPQRRQLSSHVISTLLLAETTYKTSLLGVYLQLPYLYLRHSKWALYLQIASFLTVVVLLLWACRRRLCTK